MKAWYRVCYDTRFDGMRVTAVQRLVRALFVEEETKSDRVSNLLLLL